MKKLIVTLGLGASLLAAPAFADTNSTPAKFLYGNCKQFRDTEFFRCVTVNGQDVYTNQLPSCDDEEAFRKARAQALAKRRKVTTAVLPKKEQGSLTPVGRQGPTTVEVIPPKQEPKQETKVEPPKETAQIVTITKPVDCPAKQARMKRLIDAWDALIPPLPQPTEVKQLVTIWKRGSAEDKQMDALELQIGGMVDDPCFAK